MIYLIDERDLEQTKAVVGASAAIFGFLTWQGLERMQRSLAKTLDVPETIRDLISNMIHWHFAKHGLASGGLAATSPEGSLELIQLFPNALGPSGDSPRAEIGFGEIVAGVNGLGLPVQVRRWLIGMLQHQAAWTGTTPSPVGFDYLDSEPTLADITPGMPGRQRMAERRVALWKLP